MRATRVKILFLHISKKALRLLSESFFIKTQIAAARAEAHANAAAAIGSVVAADPVCFAAVAQEASVVAAAAVAPTTFARAAIVVKILLAAENIARVATAAAALPVGTVGDDGRLVQISSYVVADHRHGRFARKVDYFRNIVNISHISSPLRQILHLRLLPALYRAGQSRFEGCKRDKKLRLCGRCRRQTLFLRVSGR